MRTELYNDLRESTMRCIPIAKIPVI